MVRMVSRDMKVSPLRKVYRIEKDFHNGKKPKKTYNKEKAFLNKISITHHLKEVKDTLYRNSKEFSIKYRKLDP